MSTLLKLGKLSAVHPLGVPKLRNYTTNLASAPDHFTCTSKMQHLGMMLNDRYGDCAIAGPGHQIQFWTAQAGNEIVISDSDILSTYSAVSGFVPDNPNTDNGCVLVNVMDYWQDKGIAGHQIGGYASLTPPPNDKSHTSFWHLHFGDLFSHRKRGSEDQTWITDMKNALYYFEGSVIGLQLPAKLQEYTNVDEWNFVPDGSNDSQPGTWGGHCVILIPGYDDFGCSLISWGKVYRVSWSFLAAYMDEARVALSRDILSGDKSPEGFDYKSLDDDILARAS